MARKNRFQIRPVKNKDGSITSWQLDFGWNPSTGKRKRISYSTRAEAETVRTQYCIERKNFGTGANILSPDEIYDAAKASQILRPWKATLSEAALFLAAHREQAARSRPVAEVVTEFLRAKEANILSRQYLKCLGSLLTRFAAPTAFGSRPICDLHGQEILDWIHGLGVNNHTQNDYRIYIGGLIKYAKLRNYLRDNPLAGFPWAKVPRTRPVCLSVPELQALLECADGLLVPILALGAFAGLRPEAEAMKLEWQDIDWAKFEICITKSKNEVSHRIIGFKDFAGPLLGWLGPYAQAGGRIYPYKSTAPYILRLERARHFAALRVEALGLEAPHLRCWTADVMRHTFATYHSAHFGDVNRTAETLGHGFSTKMLRTHYRGLVSPSETPGYWSLCPVGRLPAVGEDPHQGIQSPRSRTRSATLRRRRATDPEYRERLRTRDRARHRSAHYKARRRAKSGSSKKAWKLDQTVVDRWRL